METVFEISLWSNGNLADYLIRILLGLVFLFTLLPKSIKNRRKEKSSETMIAVALAAIGIPVWLIINSLLLWNYYAHVEEIIAAYRKDNYSIAEGPVEVLHAQAKDGHDLPDKIRIGEVEFTIQHFASTPYYRDTINNGGALTQGAFARVRYTNNDILKVEVRKANQT